MHHAEIDTSVLYVHVHAYKRKHKQNTQTMKFEISETDYANPCKKINEHSYHDEEEVQCGSSKQDFTAKGSKG